MSYTAALNGSIAVVDSSNNLVTTKLLSGLSAIISDFSLGTVTVSAAAAAIPLPNSPTNVVYLKNDGTATAVVSWIPQGGSGAVVQTLGTSSAICVVQVGQGGSTGITALTVSSAAVCTVEYFLGG